MFVSLPTQAMYESESGNMSVRFSEFCDITDPDQSGVTQVPLLRLLHPRSGKHKAVQQISQETSAFGEEGEALLNTRLRPLTSRLRPLQPAAVSRAIMTRIQKERPEHVCGISARHCQTFHQGLRKLS